MESKIASAAKNMSRLVSFEGKRLRTRGASVGPSIVQFAKPIKSQSSKSEGRNNCVAKAWIQDWTEVDSQGSALEIALDRVRVSRVANVRQDTRTVYFDLPHVPKKTKKNDEDVGEFLSDFLKKLDGHAIGSAKANVESWFGKNMLDDLIEEYYKGSIVVKCALDASNASKASKASHASESLQARFVIMDCPEDVLATDARFDIRLRLEGIQFRSQYFTCVWTLVDAIPIPDDVDSNNTRFEGFFLSDDEGTESVDSVDTDTDGDAVDDEDFGPTMEDRAEMRQALASRLATMDREWTAKADEAASWLDKIAQAQARLDAAPLSSLLVFEEIATILNLEHS